MPQIPKIALQRLGKIADPQNHPHPEIIAAFLEDSLATGEQASVLNHLAQCRDCRDILSLSIPEQIGAVSITRGGNRLLSWPVLRWVGAAACVVVVGTAVSLHYQTRSRSAELTEDRSVQVATLDRKVAEAAPTLAMQQGGNQNAMEAMKSERVPAPGHQKKAVAGSGGNSIPRAQTADVAGSRAEPNSQLQSADALEARTAPAAPASPTNEIVPGRAKEAESTIATANMAAAAKASPAAPAAGDLASTSRARLLPRWTLTSDGTLQRSLDGGISWESVTVAPQSRLRALAANGFDIWVGGSNGALYHSFDAGHRWIQVRPVVNGQVLDADVIGVEFLDPRHGSISTSTLETWTTEDAGQHWQKK
ncbi:MAG: zf-HC2 domain-containing protein [Acidobacteriaceae bacterium]|nr:zf-HC2 domain-containing protein [Acidobacteriaceae bacterium]